MGVYNANPGTSPHSPQNSQPPLPKVYRRSSLSSVLPESEVTVMMQRLGRVLCLLAIMLQLSCTLGFSAKGGRFARSSGDIDNFIRGLSYSRDQVLAYQGETKTSFLKTEGKLTDNRDFIVISREKKTASNGKSEIGVVASNEHSTYPGALLLANSRLVDNTPDVLAVQRAPLNYRVNLPGLTTDGSFQITPSFGGYQSAVNNVLNKWFEKHPNDNNVVANFQNDVSFAYSQDLMRVKFGLDFKGTQIESSIDFSAMEKQEKLIVIHRFRQIFYTVSVEPTRNPSDLFGSTVTVNELQMKTDNSKPPVLVDSVSYGRTIYVKIETSSTDREAKMLLENKFNDLKNKNEAEVTSKLQNLGLTVYVVGGASEHVELINARTIKEVNDIIVRFSKFSRTNLGFPISYSTQFIKDNSRAVVQMTTDYIETTRTVHNKGIVRLVHKGWFVMQWKLEWKELNYDGYGNPYTTQKSWGKNDQDLTSPFQEEIELPGNAQEIRVFAKEATGLAWEWWRTVIDNTGIPLIADRTFTVWGTTLYPQKEISPPV